MSPRLGIGGRWRMRSLGRGYRGGLDGDGDEDWNWN